MSLTQQIHLYSVGTDAFYTPEENEIHKRLLKLYEFRSTLRKIEANKSNPKKKQYLHIPNDDSTLADWKKEVNSLIKQEKEILTSLLDRYLLEDSPPRTFNPNMLISKNVVSLFESSFTRSLGLQTNELTKDVVIVSVFFFQVFESLVKQGFYLDGEKYIFFTSSAGQIRKKKGVFVKESRYREIEKKIMCGLTFDKINELGGINPNKFLAYLALSNSATDVWEDFDIDKTIVVDDFETSVFGTVDFIDDASYEIERKGMDVPIMHSDGCGLVLNHKTCIFRSVWLKGLLVQFPFDKFIEEKCPNKKCLITDIYGTEHDVIQEKIEIIFTKSQFKLH